MANLVQEYSYYFKTAFKEVYSSKKRIAVSVAIFSVLIFANLFINEYLLIKGLLFASITSFFEGLYYSFISHSNYGIISMIIISILSSMLLTFVFHAFMKTRSLKGTASGSGGILLGVLAPACSSCGIGIISLLGFGSVAAALPFGGKELSVIAAVILLVSTFYVSKEVVSPTCKI